MLSQAIEGGSSMDFELRIIVEKVAVYQEVIQRHTVKVTMSPS